MGSHLWITSLLPCLARGGVLSNMVRYLGIFGQDGLILVFSEVWTRCRDLVQKSGVLDLGVSERSSWVRVLGILTTCAAASGDCEVPVLAQSKVIAR